MRRPQGGVVEAGCVGAGDEGAVAIEATEEVNLEEESLQGLGLESCRSGHVSLFEDNARLKKCREAAEVVV